MSIIGTRQAAEFDFALERNGGTAADVKKMSEGSTLAKLLMVLRDEAYVVMRNLIISVSEVFNIGPTTGERKIVTATVFDSVSPLFPPIERETADDPTKAVLTRVYEVKASATFALFAASIGRTLSDLVFTQDQIIEFATTNREFLCDEECVTFFLFVSQRNLCFVRVHKYRDGDFRASFGKVDEDTGFYYAKYKHRIVAPI